MFIISEISPQFGGSMEIAEQMILQSKMAGASAVKLQLYPSDLFPNKEGFDLTYRELSFDDFKRLKEYGDTINIPVFATAFTEDRLEWCIELDQAYYKLAARQQLESADLVEKVLSLNKPTFVSIPSDYDLTKVIKVDHAIYLHCIVKYPTLLEEFSIPDFENSIFQGISDHSLGISGALYAAAHGCKYLEKHFTLSHAWQKSTEKAHLGAMTAEQLETIKQISIDMQIIDAKGLDDFNKSIIGKKF